MIDGGTRTSCSSHNYLDRSDCFRGSTNDCFRGSANLPSLRTRATAADRLRPTVRCPRESISDDLLKSYGLNIFGQMMVYHTIHTRGMGNPLDMNFQPFMDWPIFIEPTNSLPSACPGRCKIPGGRPSSVQSWLVFFSFGAAAQLHVRACEAHYGLQRTVESNGVRASMLPSWVWICMDYRRHHHYHHHSSSVNALIITPRQCQWAKPVAGAACLAVKRRCDLGEKKYEYDFCIIY